MTELIIEILITTLVFTVFGYALAFVYINKKNKRCSLCGLKSEEKCIYDTCKKKA